MVSVLEVNQKQIMNREIKFKFYKDGVMYEDYPKYLDGYSLLMILNEEDNDGYKPLQYTGIKDKNDVEIYEGDIVKYCYYKEKQKKYYINYTVEYIEVQGSDDMGTDMVGYNSEVSRGEVIGNIYENPEICQ